MIRDKDEATADPTASDNLHLLVKQVMGSGRMLALFSSRPTEETTTIGDDALEGIMKHGDRRAGHHHKRTLNLNTR